MLRLILAFLAATLVSQANPLPGYLIDQPHTMVAENVLVGITEKGAVVSGRYRFRVSPNAHEKWREPPYTLAVSLPVPVPASLKAPEDVSSAVQPVLRLKGAKYLPYDDVFYFDLPALPQEVKLAVFSFRIDRTDLEDEFEVEIQYDQPVIAVGDKDLVYYIPFLPNFERFKKQMNLKEDSFLITFESISPATLELVSPVHRIGKANTPTISVRPRHLEIIAVERKRSPSAPK